MAKEEQIKTSIDLTGEKEYRAACSSINTSLREINSEMKLATAEFANNASSSEALTRKQEVLQKQLAEQAKKAEAAEAALRKMREAGIDPTDPAYQKMQTNLNNTKAEMAKTEQQINSTSKELKQSKVDTTRSAKSSSTATVISRLSRRIHRTRQRIPSKRPSLITGWWSLQLPARLTIRSPIRKRRGSS